MNIIYFNYVILGHRSFPNNALSIFNTIKNCRNSVMNSEDILTVEKIIYSYSKLVQTNRNLI